MRAEKYLKTVFALLMLAAAGCAQVEYVGQKFPATPMSEKIEYFKARKDMPQDIYRIIGRFTLTLPESADRYIIEEILRKKGREYGGDAVCLVSEKKVKIGTYTSNDDEFGAPAPAHSNQAILNPDGTSKEIDSFGMQSTALKSEKTVVSRLIVKALLLKKRSSLED